MLSLLLSLMAAPQEPYRWKEILPTAGPAILASPFEGPHLLIGLPEGVTPANLNRKAPFRVVPEPTESIDTAVFAPLLAARCGKHGSYSLDGGVTWNQFAQEPTNAAGGSIALNSTAETIIWNTGGSTWQTFNRGNSWSLCQNLTGSFQLTADRVTPTRIWAVRDSEIWMSDNTGRSFQQLKSSLPVPHSQMHASGWGIGDLWLPAENGLWRSMNSGQSFSRVTGVDSASSVSFGKAAPGARYPAIFLSGRIAGTSGIFRSDDEARHWTRIDDIRHPYDAKATLQADPRIYGRVYLSSPTHGLSYGDHR